jgi:hypothetical protein
LNWILFCSQKSKKSLEANITTPNNLLATITENADNYAEILEHYNPHGVIVADNSADIAFEIRNIRPDPNKFKILFLVNEISLENADLIKDLYAKSVYISDKLDLLNIPKPSQIGEQLKELRKKQDEQKQADLLSQESENNTTTAEKIEVGFNEETLANTTFKADEIEIINENPRFEKQNGNTIIIGISGLQHHSGSTHTSFEIAEFLRQQCENPCVVLYNSAAYGALSDFHKVPFAKSKSGFEINKIAIYPQNMLEIAMQKHNYVICDYGVLDDIQGKNQTINYEKSDIKIMLCSSANWEIRDTMAFLNSSNMNGKKDISYIFYPVTKSKFSGINRQFVKLGCHAFRLSASLDCLQPCKENKEIYAEILRLKTSKRKKILGIF